MWDSPEDAALWFPRSRVASAPPHAGGVVLRASQAALSLLFLIGDRNSHIL